MTLFLLLISQVFFIFNQKSKEENNTLGMILVHPNNHPSDSDLVELGQDNKLVALHGYPHESNLSIRNIVNAAYYL